MNDGIECSIAESSLFLPKRIGSSSLKIFRNDKSTFFLHDFYHYYMYVADILPDIDFCRLS